MREVERVGVLIAGAGFAGAATAAALARRGVRDVLVLEAEPIPGQHGSGRNAAMARRVIEDPLLARLATQSVAGIATSVREDPAGFPSRCLATACSLV